LIANARSRRRWIDEQDDDDCRGIPGLGALPSPGGCATGKAKVITVPGGSLDKYNTVAITVLNDVGRICPDNVAPALQAAAIQQIRIKYADVFAEARPAPTGAGDELLVEVHITKYKKGSRLARAMLIGLGSSKISTNLVFLDSAMKRQLATGRLGLTWALGGIIGASKGIEELVDDAGRKIANAIVSQRTGKPGPK